MVSKIKYEMVIILTNEFNNNELKTWIFNCAKALRKLGALEISVVSCNKKNFTYLLKDQIKGNFIEISFSILPKYITNILDYIKLDDNILRSLIVKRNL